MLGPIRKWGRLSFTLNRLTIVIVRVHYKGSLVKPTYMSVGVVSLPMKSKG